MLAFNFQFSIFLFKDKQVYRPSLPDQEMLKCHILEMLVSFDNFCPIANFDRFFQFGNFPCDYRSDRVHKTEVFLLKVSKICGDAGAFLTTKI
jgi:hypothetical protein